MVSHLRACDGEIAGKKLVTSQLEMRSTTILLMCLFFIFRSLLVGQLAEERLEILVKSNVGRYIDINNVRNMN